MSDVGETTIKIGSKPAGEVQADLTTETEWARSGTTFSARTRADKTKKLPGGIYRYVATMTGWYLDRTSDRFEFPFKVYDSSQDVIDRIKTFWKTNGTNLGVLLNGLRGAGKTMAAQLLSNDLIDEFDIPVLVIRNPIPLQVVFDNAQQDMIIIFDEFEKTHNEREHPGAQQQLLSTIDGMSRSTHRRLFLFTTNDTNINVNFVDRPSRIHYKFEFKRVADEVIEGLIDDGLPVNLQHFKQEIFDFLNTRDICTIDIVKSVIAEVRTFEESPLQFEDMLNIAKGQPPAFSIHVINPETGEILDTISSYFKLDQSYARYAPLLSGNRRSIESFIANGHRVDIHSRHWNGGMTVSLVEKCDEDDCWLAEVRLPQDKTIWAEYAFLHKATLWLDEKPSGWKLPSPTTARKDDKIRESIEEKFEDSECAGTVYGTGKRGTFKIKIEPNRDYAPSKMTISAWDKLS